MAGELVRALALVAAARRDQRPRAAALGLLGRTTSSAAPPRAGRTASHPRRRHLLGPHAAGKRPSLL